MKPAEISEPEHSSLRYIPWNWQRVRKIRPEKMLCFGFFLVDSVLCVFDDEHRHAVRMFSFSCLLENGLREFRRPGSASAEWKYELKTIKDERGNHHDMRNALLFLPNEVTERGIAEETKDKHNHVYMTLSTLIGMLMRNALPFSDLGFYVERYLLRPLEPRVATLQERSKAFSKVQVGNITSTYAVARMYDWQTGLFAYRAHGSYFYFYEHMCARDVVVAFEESAGDRITEVSEVLVRRVVREMEESLNNRFGLAYDCLTRAAHNYEPLSWLGRLSHKCRKSNYWMDGAMKEAEHAQLPRVAGVTDQFALRMIFNVLCAVEVMGARVNCMTIDEVGEFMEKGASRELLWVKGDAPRAFEVAVEDGDDEFSSCDAFVQGLAEADK